MFYDEITPETDNSLSLSQSTNPKPAFFVYIGKTRNSCFDKTSYLVGRGKAPLKQSDGLISVTLNLTQHVHQSGTDLGNFVVNTPAQMMDPVQEGHKSHWRPKIPKRYIFQ